MAQAKQQRLAVALGGFGAVGKKVARCLDDGMAGLRLVAVSARDKERAARETAAFAAPVPVLGLDELAGVADVVVECAPAHLLDTMAVPVLEAGKTLVVISAAALIASDRLIDLAADRGATIIVPSGALLGLDAVTAAAEGTIRSVRLITRKPVEGLAGAPHVMDQGIELDNLEAPLKLFQGSARQAARGFPANLNVAAALGLAGLGPDRTEVEIWADPGVTRNIHLIEVSSDSADFTMTIENIPSQENPRTGKITALSVIAALRKLAGPLRMGT
ncbi:MAG: aspartate dehydrogenase [Rhodospirillales bacterium]|nr:aspartate dehydrogenase [Rhodospirillales bacterium]MDP6774485.1 aspartate dehydrogenase [Rhodospirillales bacterium]